MMNSVDADNPQSAMPTAASHMIRNGSFCLQRYRSASSPHGQCAALRSRSCSSCCEEGNRRTLVTCFVALVNTSHKRYRGSNKDRRRLVLWMTEGLFILTAISLSIIGRRSPHPDHAPGADNSCNKPILIDYQKRLRCLMGAATQERNFHAN